jgi:hypothetical protein
MCRLILAVADAASVWLMLAGEVEERRSMIDKTFAKHFAQEWIEAWNSHDLKRISLALRG